MEKYNKLFDIVMALITVYGPLSRREVERHIQEYFPEDFKNYTKKEIGMVLRTLDEEGTIGKSSKGYSLYDEIEDEQMASFFPSGLMLPDLEEKKFTPEELLSYADVLELKGKDYYDDFREYFYALPFKKGVDIDAEFRIALTLATGAYDDDFIYEDLRDKMAGDFDRRDFREHIFNYTLNLPRGVYKGHSLKEVAELIKVNMPDDPEGDDNKIPMPEKPLHFGHYTYEDCIELGNKVKDTDIFEKVNSDNVLELCINGEAVYVQLLGYYGGDRNVIVYGSREEAKKTYPYMSDPNGDYPDIMFRADFLEAVLDAGEKFLTSKIADTLKERSLPELPLFVHFKDGGAYLADEEELDLFGAVLESLLHIYEFAKDDLEDYYAEQEELIFQLYLSEEGLDLGDYYDPEFAEPVIPFKVLPIERPEETGSEYERKDIFLGIYLSPYTINGVRPYITIIYDGDDDQILRIITHPAEEMSNICTDIADLLKERKITPNLLYVNSPFSFQALMPLMDHYYLSFEYDEEGIVNELYSNMLGYGNKEEKETVLH